LQKGLQSPVSYEQLRDLGPEPCLHRVLDEGRKAGLVAADVDVSWLRLLLQGYRARREALQRYRPSIYAGRLTLFRAAEEDPEFLRKLEADLGIDVRDPALGWGAYSTETVTVREVSGNHSTMCMEPNVQTLASSLQAWIQQSTPGRPAQPIVHPARLSALVGAPTARQEESL
jgi:thioesterase domain-containing protein